MRHLSEVIQTVGRLENEVRALKMRTTQEPTEEQRGHSHKELDALREAVDTLRADVDALTAKTPTKSTAARK